MRRRVFVLSIIFTTVFVLYLYQAVQASPLFITGFHYGAGDGPRLVAIGDLDGDSDPDLAVANRDSYDVSVLINTSNQQLFGLLAPANGSVVASAPTLSWSAGTYDLFKVFIVPPIYGQGYYPINFWYMDTEFPLPSELFNLIIPDYPCFWVVLGVNTGTLDWEVSEVWTFTKGGIPPSPPTGLIIIADSGDDYLAWYPNDPSENVTHYIIYWREASAGDWQYNLEVGSG